MIKINFKRYSVYLIRWQLSTPILAWCIVVFSGLGATWATIIANLIGGLIFFWIDSFIFKSKNLDVYWHVKESIICSDCKQLNRGYRLVKTENYDRSNDKNPQFRCESCSKSKTEKLRNSGICI